jgi:glycosyltransferase involved in cell wall biosynthesis
MRVLFVTHLYPPEHSAGVEVFASTTARLLVEAGHDVVVFTTTKDIARADMSVQRRTHDGVPVVELANNLFARRFEETWRRPEVDQAFMELLDEFRPDVVHVHHLMYLSAGILDVCKERGVPVMMTLHDFWLGCARFGQLLHADGSRCAHVDTARCGTCLPSFEWRQTDTARRVARGVASVARLTGVNLTEPLRRLRKGGTSPPGNWEAPDAAATAEYEHLAAARRDDLVQAVNRAVSCVLLPAAFMRDWYARLGLRRELLFVETTGVDWEAAGAHERVQSESGRPLRFLFLGTLTPHKGADVLLEAWAALPDEARAKAELRVLGPDEHAPAYVAAIRGRAAELGVTVGGRLTRHEVQVEMARTDVLVTPSQWAEIRPLVMLEAHAAGARVIATDLGGMAELVHDGVAGRLFPEGDADALRACIEEEIASAEQRTERPQPSALFRGWPDVAAAMVEHNRALL